MCVYFLFERAAVEKEKSKVVTVIDVEKSGPLVLPNGLDASSHESLIDIDRLKGHVVLLIATSTFLI